MNSSDLEAGASAPSGRNEPASPTYQSHRPQDSATAHDQGQATDSYEHSSEGGRAGPATSNDAAQDEPQLVTVDVPMMLSTKQIWNQQDPRKQSAPPPRSAKTSTQQPNLTQSSARAYDQGQHEQSPKGRQAGPNDTAQGEPQTITNILPQMLSTNQIRNQQDIRKQDAVAPRSMNNSKNQPNLVQNSATPHSQHQPSERHEQSSEGTHAGPKESNDIAREELDSDEDMGFSMFTEDIWNLEDPRKQDATAPRTAKTAPKMLPTNQIWRQEDPRQQSATAPRSTNPEVPRKAPSNDKASTQGHESPNHKMPSSERQANGNQAHSPLRAFSPGAPKHDINERDLEAGTRPTHGLGRDKDKYDIDGRERVILPKRGDRQQPYTAPKSNYGPGAIPPPEPTYLDRHGRTELQVFQALVGVHFLDNAGAPISIEQKQQQPASVMSDIFVPSRAAAYRHRNRGLYDRCISMDMKMRVMYSFSHYMISFLYLLQILVAATLTAISSYTNIASTAITVLGAINTVLAGILAWLNGQGMPNRYHRARDQFREVVKAIEASERLFATIDYMDWPEGTRPTPMGEKDRLEKLYDQARLDMEANYPDTHQAPDQNAEMLEAKKMEDKVDKHKKQKKVAAEALKSLQEEKQQLEAKLASKVAGFVEKHGKDDDYERELQEREESVRKTLEQVMLVKNHYEQRQHNLQQVIIDMCAEKGLDSDELFAREAASRR